jgi:hypothetical protein
MERVLIENLIKEIKKENIQINQMVDGIYYQESVKDILEDKISENNYEDNISDVLSSRNIN